MSAHLHVELYGNRDGAPLLAIHGVTGFGARFRRLAEHGLPDRRWVCPDLRGHGSSPATAPWATRDHLDDLLAVLDRFELGRVDVVAHSFGGHLALHLLAAAPERVGDLVLLDPASASDGDAFEGAATEFARDPGWATVEEARREMLDWFQGQETEELEVELSTLVQDGGRWRLPCSVPAIVTAYGEIARPLPALDPADRRLLLVEAPPDVTTVSEQLRDGLRAAFGPRMQRVVLDRGTHVVYRTAFEETAAAVRDFLADRDRRP